jgi:putative transposase
MEKYQFTEGVGIYFVTFTIVEWLPLFIEETPCRIITESLNYCIQQKDLMVNAYVIMPNHIHAIVFDRQYSNNRLKDTLDEFRKFTGRRLADYCDASLSPAFREAIRQAAGKDRARRIWQPTRHPEGIFGERFWRQKFNYIHENPVRKGLVLSPEAWRFSSARYWMEECNHSEVELCSIGGVE